MEIKLGKYKHFKGGLYEVIAIAKHFETLEELVVYKHLDGDQAGEYWVRSVEMFTDDKELEDGTKVKRFEYVG